jgi:hypothetical protein
MWLLPFWEGGRKKVKKEGKGRQHSVIDTRLTSKKKKKNREKLRDYELLY